MEAALHGAQPHADRDELLLRTVVEVAFEPAVTPSLLAVEVRGTFGGNERVKIRTFEIPGTKPTPPEHDTTKVIRGERIKVVPAQ